MTRLLFTYVLLATCFLLGGCDQDPWMRGAVEGYLPVYDNNPTFKQISYLPARSSVHPGKLYTYGKLVLQAESDSGLHLISYQDPAHPVRTAFLRIPGFRTATVKGDYLYADNYNDLVVIPLKELPSLSHVGRVPGMWTQKDFPPFEGAYFECVDHSKGAVIGWQKGIVNNPQCRAERGHKDTDPSQLKLSAGIVVEGDYLYVSDKGNLMSYSIAQPTAPVLKQQLTGTDRIDSIYMFNELLATVRKERSRISLYDLSNPAVINYKTGLTPPYACEILVPAGKYVYSVGNYNFMMCSPSKEPEVNVYELSADYNTLTLAGSLQFDTTYAVIRGGNYLYAGTSKGISIVDVSAPPVITRFAEKQGDIYTDMIIEGTLLFARSATWIACYDISSPASITLISKLAY